MERVTVLADPCPLPSRMKDGACNKKHLNDKEKLLYAPMADVGELLYDKDAVYIELKDHQINFSTAEQCLKPEGDKDIIVNPTQGPGEEIVSGKVDF